MNRLDYYIKEAFKSIFKNKNTSFATIFSMMIALLILGITLCIVLNINNFTLKVKQEVSGMQIFMKNTINEEELEDFKKVLEANEDFENISFVSKQELMKSFVENTNIDFKAFDDIDNPCENSFRVYIKNSEKSAKLVNSLQKDLRISSISFYEEDIKNLIKTSETVSLISVIIIIILFMLSLMVIENMIKIAIFSRMKEIEIMKIIGATNWFIRLPFIIEGAILGLIGSGLAFLIVFFAYSKIYTNMPEAIFFHKYLIDKNEMSKMLFSLFLSSGIGIGMLGSIISLRKYLKV